MGQAELGDQAPKELKDHKDKWELEQRILETNRKLEEVQGQLESARRDRTTAGCAECARSNAWLGSS